MHFPKLIALIGPLLVSAFAAEAKAAEAPVDYLAEVQPILSSHCLKCHGGVKREAGVSFIDRATALQPSRSGNAPIVPGEPDQSLLLERVFSQDPKHRMPPDGPALSDREIQTLRRWIAQGAAWPEHWAFQPITRPALPKVDNQTWSRTAVDRFVLERLEAHQIQPSPEAEKATLVRRLYLDLVGLLPTPQQIMAYERNPSPDAYERLVDRLLASPHFGERWGRHWLDLARYADTDGYEVDAARPHAWYWRDWVIQAINADMPLDQFTIEQLAGDLLPEATPQQILATAFNRQTLTNNEGGIDKEEYRLYAAMDRVHTTATVWLGLTVTCTQCHDHPYDPVEQHEFYQLLAFFNNADEADYQWPLADQEKVQLPVLLERTEPRTTYLLERGDYLRPDTDQPVEPQGLAVLHPLVARCHNDPDRLDLARWLMDPQNPLTARVLANDVWLRLFGVGLVRTPEDFGSRGEAPTHPELLDWLAVEFRENGWSRKNLIRQIVLSATYRQSSAIRSQPQVVDPRNELLHRQNRLRLEAEIIRDTSLQAGGLLSRQIGGPSVFPPFPEDLTKIDFRSDLKWQESEGAQRYRRGMYTFFKRTLPHPNLIVFDCPDASATAVQRRTSNTPLQALTMLNNEVFVEAAQALGAELADACGQTDELRLENAFRRCLGRPMKLAETRELLELLEDSRAAVLSGSQAEDQQGTAGSADTARTTGASTAELAAWTLVASTLLNLDEFITRQ